MSRWTTSNNCIFVKSVVRSLFIYLVLAFRNLQSWRVYAWISKPMLVLLSLDWCDLSELERTCFIFFMILSGKKRTKASYASVLKTLGVLVLNFDLCFKTKFFSFVKMYFLNSVGLLVNRILVFIKRSWVLIP